MDLAIKFHAPSVSVEPVARARPQAPAEGAFAECTLVNSKGEKVLDFGMRLEGGLPTPEVIIHGGSTWVWRRGWTYQLAPHVRLERSAPSTIQL